MPRGSRRGSLDCLRLLPTHSLDPGAISITQWRSGFDFAKKIFFDDALISTQPVGSGKTAL